MNKRPAQSSSKPCRTNLPVSIAKWPAWLRAAIASEQKFWKKCLKDRMLPASLKVEDRWMCPMCPVKSFKAIGASTKWMENMSRHFDHEHSDAALGTSSSKQRHMIVSLANTVALDQQMAALLPLQSAPSNSPQQFLSKTADMIRNELLCSPSCECDDALFKYGGMRFDKEVVLVLESTPSLNWLLLVPSPIRIIVSRPISCSQMACMPLGRV